MKKREYHNSKSFVGKTRIALALLGIIPFLLVVYLFFNEENTLTDQFILFSALALLSILAGFSLVRASADQLVGLAKKTAEIGTGEELAPIQIKADEELNDIVSDFNIIIGELQQTQKGIKEQTIQLMQYAKELTESHKRAKEEKVLRDRLGRYVGKHIVNMLINSPQSALVENERREVTILFADIRSFTTIAESMAAEDVVLMLNQFFNDMVNIIFKHDGILDKFVGDQLMAVFGVIPSDNNPPSDAIETAIEMQSAILDLMKVRSAQDKETFAVGIGINTGSVIIGNVGANNRMDYTVVGDCVNVAARLQGLAAGGEIIIGEQTYHHIQGLFDVEKRGKVSVKNKTKPIICYNVLR